jgi:hypothetical protein|tara:strand:+ start:43 stop:147 length:105 start_codon:yes stop_codon:yes gene_type:complete
MAKAKKSKKVLSFWDKVERGLRRLFSKALPSKRK